MTNYQKQKEKARDEAIKWSLEENGDISWSEFAEITEHFQKLAKRYGLVQEFRENGII